MKQPISSEIRQENRSFLNRILFAALFIFLGLAVLLARYWYLQVYSYDKYTTQAENNRVKLISDPPSRGYIYDRNGYLLADNKPVFTAMLSPDEV